MWYTKTGNLYTAAKPTSRGGEWQRLSHMETHMKKYFSFPKGFRGIFAGKETRRQKLSRKKVGELGLQSRSPSFPMRLFSDPPSLYTFTYVCTHTCTQQHSAGSERTNGASPGTFLPEFPLWGHGKEGKRAEVFAHAYVGSVCLFLQSPGPGVKRRVILTGTNYQYQVWK